VLSQVKNITTKKSFSIACLFLLINNIIAAQQTWNNLTLKYPITKRIAFETDQQIRLNQYFNHLRTSIEPGITIRATSNLNFKGKYRHTWLEHRTQHRLSFDISNKFQLKNEKITYIPRIRFQRSFKEVLIDGRDVLRLNQELKYNFSKTIDTFIAIEIFELINSEFKFQKLRGTTGVDVKLSEIIKWAIYYRIESAQSENLPNTLHIIGTAIIFEFGNKKKEGEFNSSFNF